MRRWHVGLLAAVAVAAAAVGVNELRLSIFDGGPSAVYRSSPTGNYLELSGTLTASEFTEHVNAVPTGPLTVRAAAGENCRAGRRHDPDGPRHLAREWHLRA